MLGDVCAAKGESVLRQFFDDVKNGENLDLYATLALAVVLAVLKPILDFFGINISPSALVPLTLAVLAAMTVVLLVNRRKMASLERQLIQRTQSDIVTAFPESYGMDLGCARRILQTGIHLASNLNDYHDQYELILKNKRSSIRFLIATPGGNALQMTALRFAGGTTRVGQEQARMESSLNVISELTAKYPGRVELRVIDYLLEYSGLWIESGSGEQVIYVERYTFRHYGGARKPKFTYFPGSPWFYFMKEEMEELWKAATPYRIETRA
jgi:hypothetical protein